MSKKYFLPDKITVTWAYFSAGTKEWKKWAINEINKYGFIIDDIGKKVITSDGEIR